MSRRTKFGVVAVALLVALASAGCTSSDGDDEDAGVAPTAAPADVDPIEVVNTDAWPMHPIDGRYRGANALGAADVDGDGHTDYVTNYEFDQRWVLARHPGAGDEVRESWPSVEIWRPDPLVEGNGRNPESTALGDFDGDGAVDAVGAHGFSDLSAFEGSAPGVHLVWGPPAEQVMDEDAWIDGGWVPATVDVGHPHWVAAHDVNGDGLVDVAVGGRRHGGGGGYDNPDSPNGNGTFTGLGWLEAPGDPAQRRDLAAWRFNRIDADQFSGHGFVFADLDGDGDDDVVDANADFDTPEDQEEVVWYENPGDGTDAQRGEWPRATLLRDPAFYAKPSVAVGDVDGDGDEDVVTQTDDELIFFRNDGGQPLRFETLRIDKPQAIAWRSRPVRLADLDRDGDLDLVGMLIHADNELPADKASAYVLLNEGDPWSSGGWRLVPVKWGPGPTMLIPGFGEKWDQVDVTDVDGDGDLDIVANCEEWWVEPKGEVVPFFTEGLATSSVAVVWFENRLGDEPGAVTERDGTVEVHAERPSVLGDSTWVERAPLRADPAGPAALQAHNGLAPDGGSIPFDGSTGARYDVDVEGGEYTVWARLYSPGAFSAELGGDTSDSVWIAVAGGAPQVLGDAPGGATDTWTWVRLASPVELDAGTHPVTLRVRERGVAVDAIVLAADPAFVPG